MKKSADPNPQFKESTVLNVLEPSEEHNGIWVSEVIVCEVPHFVAFVHRPIDDTRSLAYNLRKALNVEPLVSQTKWQDKEGVVIVGRNDNPDRPAYELIMQCVRGYKEE